MAIQTATLSSAAADRTAHRPAKTRDRFHRGVWRWVILAVCVLIAIVMFSPFVLMLLNAFKNPTEYSINGPLAIPREFYFDGLVNFWTRTQFPVKLFNSIFISAAVSILAVGLSVISAYAIGIGRIKGRMWLTTLFLMATMLPEEALMYPLYKMAGAVGLGNSQWSVIIIYTVIRAAFGTYLLGSVMNTFPRAMLEAAQIDGAGRWTVLTRVVLPVVKPTLAVLFVFFFIWTWNEFFIPLVMLTTPDTQTVPVAIAALQGDRLMDAPTTNAGALLSVIPTLIFFLIFQRTLTRGITAGSVK